MPSTTRAMNLPPCAVRLSVWLTVDRQPPCHDAFVSNGTTGKFCTFLWHKEKHDVDHHTKPRLATNPAQGCRDCLLEFLRRPQQAGLRPECRKHRTAPSDYRGTSGCRRV